MPRLTFERFMGALFTVSATGRDGDFVILYSENLTSWEPVGSLTVAGGRGFSSFKLDEADGRGFFRLEGDEAGGAMPTLVMDPPERADLCFTASGTDGYFDLMFSADLKSWEKVETLSVIEGSGVSLFDTGDVEVGYFRLEHRY